MFCSSLIFSACRSMMSLSQLVSPPDTEASTSTLELCSSGQPLTRERRTRMVLRTAVLNLRCVLSCKNGSASLLCTFIFCCIQKIKTWIYSFVIIHLVWFLSQKRKLKQGKDKKIGKKKKEEDMLARKEEEEPRKRFLLLDGLQCLLLLRKH